MVGASAQTKAPSRFLSPELLQPFGLHLPGSMGSGMTAVIQFSQDQAKLTVHQKLTIFWDSIPGQTGTLLKSVADTMPLGGNFTLQRRERAQSGSPGKPPIDMIQDTLVTVAVTDSGEIRGLNLQGDRRTVYADDMLSPSKNEAWVSPQVTLLITLPDDPQICTVVFFKPLIDQHTGQMSLRKVGSIDLSGRAKNDVP
jgi:hypothetical protein